jgi:hypothetical protein
MTQSTASSSTPTANNTPKPRLPKLPRPDWKVGDIVYYRIDGAGWWYEKEIVNETKLSWHMLAPGAPAWRKDPTTWRYLDGVMVVPKSMRNRDGRVITAGTKLSLLRQKWTMKFADAISKELSWRGKFKDDAVVLRDIAKAMGMEDAVKEFPEEDMNVKSEPNQS